MGKLNMDRMREVKNELDSNNNYGDYTYDKLEKGSNVRRVLPPKGDKDTFFATGFMHFGLGDDGKRAVTCLETYGEGHKCPICSYAEELSKSKNKDDREYAKHISRVKRTYINVINRDNGEDEPMVLPIGATVLRGIVDLICDPDYGDITDFDEGTDITITKSGSGLKTTYAVTPKRNTSIASEEFDADELDEKMADLDGLFRKESPAKLQAILDGEDYDESDDDDDSGYKELEGAYDEMDVDELIDLVCDRGMELPAKPTRLKLIRMLEEYDANPEFDEEDEEDFEEPEEKPVKPSKSASRPASAPKSTPKESGDALQDEIAKAIARRKGK